MSDWKSSVEYRLLKQLTESMENLSYKQKLSLAKKGVERSKEEVYKGIDIKDPKNDGCPGYAYRPDINVMKCEKIPRINLKELYDKIYYATAAVEKTKAEFYKDPVIGTALAFFLQVVDKKFDKRSFFGGRKLKKKSRKLKKKSRKLKKKSRKKRRR